MAADLDRHLLFGLLALQNGLIGQDQLAAAFQAWTQDKLRGVAEHLVARGDLDTEQSAGVEAMVGLHLKLHGDAAQSLAALGAGVSTREHLARVGDPDLQATLDHMSLGATVGEDADRTATFSIGTATSDGQRFRVLRPHARGGLGEVLVALDGELHREVALKRILDRHADDANSRARFLLEAEITGGLEHPGIVPVYGLGSYGDGRPYYAMRFIRGDSLKDAIDRFHADQALQSDIGRRSLELRNLLRRFLDVCNAIEYAHSRGVLHRDIKPGNVIVGKHGETLVVDWGLAKAAGRTDETPGSNEPSLVPSSGIGSAMTLAGWALGTPAYMSPEQATGDLDRLGPRSDVYSLGATLYALLTGEAPFTGTDVVMALARVRAGDFPPPRQVKPTIDRALEAVCLKAMAVDPESRYPTARALADDVERWVADEPVSAWREPFARRTRRWARRNRLAVTAAAVAMLAGLAGLGAVAVVQARANADLSRANEKVQARFALARDAIRLYHGEVSEDVLLKEKRFDRLRVNLLRGAAGFYGRLEGLLKGGNDRDSRLELGSAYDELARLTSAIGDKREALAVYNKALELRRETAAAFGDDPALTTGMVNDLNAVALLKFETGDPAGALTLLKGASTLAAPIARGGFDKAEAALGSSQHLSALALAATGKTTDALRSYQEALATRRPLAAAHPDDQQIQKDLAMTLNNLANLVANTGDLAVSLQLHDEALRVRRRFTELYPDDPAHRANLALSYYNIGVARVQVGQFAEAIPPLKESLAIRLRLVETDPAVTDFQRDLARSHYLIGVALGQSDQFAASLDPYFKALLIQQRLADANPAVDELRGDLARTHNAIAVSRTETGDNGGAMASYRKSVAVFRTIIAASPTASQPRRDLAGTLTNLGALYLVSGDRAEAVRSFDEATATLQALADADLADPRLRRDLAQSYTLRATVEASAGLVREALLSDDQALKVLAPLANGGRRDPEDRRELARVHEDAGGLKARLGRIDDALGSCHEAVAIRERLAADQPAESGFQYDLARSFAILGRFQSRSRQPSDALPTFRQCVATLERVESPTPIQIYSLACYRALLAGAGPHDFDEAARGMADLRRSLAAGYADLANIRADADLDSLRGRDDFKLLLLDLDMPADPFWSPRGP